MCLVPFIMHNIFMGNPCCATNQQFILFCGPIVFHYMDKSHWANPFISWQTSTFCEFCYGYIYKLVCRNVFNSSSGIAGSFGKLYAYLSEQMLNFFPNSCSILHSQQPCVMVPISPYPQQYFFIVFLLQLILVGVKWYLTVVSLTFP